MALKKGILPTKFKPKSFKNSLELSDSIYQYSSGLLQPENLNPMKNASIQKKTCNLPKLRQTFNSLKMKNKFNQLSSLKTSQKFATAVEEAYYGFDAEETTHCGLEAGETALESLDYSSSHHLQLADDQKKLKAVASTVKEWLADPHKLDLTAIVPAQFLHQTTAGRYKQRINPKNRHTDSVSPV